MTFALGLAAPAAAQGPMVDHSAYDREGGALISQGWEVASRFLVTSSFSAGNVTFWAGLRHNEDPQVLFPDITWTLYRGTAEDAVPGQSILQGFTPTTAAFEHTWFVEETIGQKTIQRPMFDIYAFEFSLPGITLADGWYWLSLTTSADEELFWQYSAFETGDALARRPSSSPFWTYQEVADARFEISAEQQQGPPQTVVPEPLTMILLGTGLAGVAGAARRRKRIADPVS